MQTTFTKQELEIIKTLIADKVFNKPNFSLYDPYVDIYTKLKQALKGN
jgi:hypothetical protein